MEQNLIAVFNGTINHQNCLMCNARELHEFLQSKQDFSAWIKNRIKKYSFLKNQDFCSFDKIIERGKGATVRTEYHITLDMAKELAMVENNAMGRQIRRYFIDCEKQIRQQPQALLQKKDHQIETLIGIIREIEKDCVNAWNERLLDDEQRKFIRLIVKHKAQLENKAQWQIYTAITQKFGKSYVDCKFWQFDAICRFLGYAAPEQLNLPRCEVQDDYFSLTYTLPEIGLNYNYNLQNK